MRKFRFDIDYNGKPEQLALIYDTDGYGFFVEPWGEAEGMFSLSVNYLCLTTTGEDNCVVKIDGFCPCGEWIYTDYSVPQNKPGRLKLTGSTNDLVPGDVYGINDAHWPVYVNPDTGWVCVGNPEKSGEAVEFINNCVAVIGEDSTFLALWLKPRDLPPLTFGSKSLLKQRTGKLISNSPAKLFLIACIVAVASVILLVLAAMMWAREPYRINRYIEKHCNFEGTNTCYIDMREVFKKDYDKIYVVGAWTSAESVRNTLRIDNYNKADASILRDSDHKKIILVKNNKFISEHYVVNYIEGCTGTNKGCTNHIFQVIKSPVHGYYHIRQRE